MAIERRRLARGLKISLDVLFYVVFGVGILLVVSLPISWLTDYQDGWDVNIPVAVGENTLFPQLDVEVGGGVSLASENVRITRAHGELRFLHHSLPLHLAVCALILLFMGAFLWALTLLRRILASTAAGRPFDPDNPRRLNTLGWVIVSSGFLVSLLQYMASAWVLSRVEVLTLPLTPSLQIHLELIICGLLVLVLSSIWKEAVRLAEEESLTV
jgi:hypothetical protein